MTTTADKVEELKEVIAATKDAEIAFLERGNYRLSDAIREGSSITTQEYGWGQGETACALHAGVIAARARGFLK